MSLSPGGSIPAGLWLIRLSGAGVGGYVGVRAILAGDKAIQAIGGYAAGLGINSSHLILGWTVIGLCILSSLAVLVGRYFSLGAGCLAVLGLLAAVLLWRDGSLHIHIVLALSFGVSQLGLLFSGHGGQWVKA